MKCSNINGLATIRERKMSKKIHREDRVYINDVTGEEDTPPDTDLQHYDIDLKTTHSPIVAALADEIRRVGGSRVLDVSDHGDGSFTVYVAPVGGMRVRRNVSFNIHIPIERIMAELSSYFIGIR